MTHGPMRDIYSRLQAKGLDRGFLQDYVLPDWWNDTLASVPASRGLAEGYLARDLGLEVAALRSPSAELSLSFASEPCFKRYRNEVDVRALAAARVFLL